MARKIVEFEKNLRELKRLCREKREMLDPEKLEEYAKFIRRKEEVGFESGWDNLYMFTAINYLRHLSIVSLPESALNHKEVVDRVVNWFSLKGYRTSREEPFIVNGLDIRPDVFLYKPGELGGVECKGSKRGVSDILKGLGQVLIYQESFNFAYLAASNRTVLVEPIKNLARKIGFGLLFVNGDNVEEIVKPLKKSTIQVIFSKPSFRHNWRPDNQRRVISVLRHTRRVKKEHLARYVAERCHITIEEAKKGVSELEREGILGLEGGDYVLLV